MTERNPYSQYNYDSFDQASSPRRRRDASLRERITSRLTNPVFATAALLLTGAAFAGIIIASYPSSNNLPQDNVPIIQADAGDLHQQPDNPGGMQVPYEDSTVFNSIRATDMKESAPVEDLLAEEKPMDKVEAFAKEAEAMFDKDGKPVADKAAAAEPAAGAANDASVPASEITENVDSDIPIGEAANDNTASGSVTKKIPVQEEKIPPQVRPSQAAGTSPETLAFVKSVLNEKDNKASDGSQAQVINTKAELTQPAIQKIEPAAGAADTSAKAIGGSYYVQLGSVTSEGGAATEWKHLQKTFTSLQGQQFRVQRADLGEKGVRYRIQAGPMNKDTASAVCASIKTQKPGGCLLVQ